jgi:hypothetical protein
LFFEDSIFFIHIYRQTKKKYYSELKDDFKKYESMIVKEIDDEEYLKHFHDDKETGKRYRRWFYNEGKSPWELNQIIGWIHFYSQGNTIKANLWFIKAKRINKTPKRKIIDYIGKLGDVTDIEYSNNAKIKKDVIQFIENAQKGLHGYGLEKYYLDSSWLLKIISHLDIKSIVESNNKMVE